MIDWWIYYWLKIKTFCFISLKNRYIANHLLSYYTCNFYLPLTKEFVLIIFFWQSSHGHVSCSGSAVKTKLLMFSASPSPWRTLFSEDRADWMEANYLMRTPSVSLSHMSANWANNFWVPQFQHRYFRPSFNVRCVHY